MTTEEVDERQLIDIPGFSRYKLDTTARVWDTEKKRWLKMTHNAGKFSVSMISDTGYNRRVTKSYGWLLDIVKGRLS